jgi:hypothetical protein
LNRVSEEKEAIKVDSGCRSLTASWVREEAKTHKNIETCNFFEVKSEIRKKKKN